MKVFKDAEGRDWTIDINLGSREAVKAKTDVDFLDVSSIEKLADHVLFAAMLQTLCDSQIRDKRLTVEEFESLMVGATLESAIGATRRDLADFFPEPPADEDHTAEDPAAENPDRLIWRLAGIARVNDPRRLTLRQLVWMAEAVRQEQWQHTAEILAMLHNSNCKKGQSKTASFFNPTYRRRQKLQTMSKEEFKMLAMAFNRRIPQQSGKLIGGGTVPIGAKS